MQEKKIYKSNEEEKLEKKRNYVSLMTIHNAKGLEFKNVFLIAFCDVPLSDEEQANFDKSCKTIKENFRK